MTLREDAAVLDEAVRVLGRRVPDSFSARFLIRLLSKLAVRLRQMADEG
jgi:hypothetical protein